MADQDRLEHVLQQLEEGRISTSDAAAQVRQLTFPVQRPKTAWQTVEDDAMGDPPVHRLGSAFELSRAYVTGRINHAQYEALAKAVSDAMKAQSSGER
jgi:hypothetical protein